MPYIIQKQLPSSEEVLKKLPLTKELADQVEKDRQEIKDILSGKDPRQLLIIGPCSAWPDTAVIEYAQKLKPLADKVSKKLKIVMRVYLQKPRTTVGWLGAMNQIDPLQPPDLEKGIYYSRKMMLEVVKIGLPLADEAVFTHNDGYVVDLLSWVAIGARSSEDQEHRIFASMIEHPVGIKNPTSGSIRIAMNSLKAAQSSHVFGIHKQQVQTPGNPFAHLILRGGSGKPNYDQATLEKVAKNFAETSLENKAVIIDASHDNCLDEDGVKHCELQSKVIFDVLDSVEKNKDLKPLVKGFMVESFLVAGTQKVVEGEPLTYGQSITDPCLGWEETEDFVNELAQKL